MREYKPQQRKTTFERVLQAIAQTRIGGWMFINVFPAIDRPLMRVSGGRLNTGFGQPFVLLHVRGARTGVERTIPLLATKTGDAIVLVASKAGASAHPAWYHNVRASADVEATFDGARRPMRAEIFADGAERERWWAIACDNYSGYATYQARAGERLIPIVVLRRR